MKFRQIRLFSVLLLLPVPSVVSAQSADNTTHTVVSGDTLWSIGRKYYGDPDKYTLLLEYNPEIKDTHSLRKGQVLQIGPDATKPESSSGTDGAESARPVRKRQKPFIAQKKWDGLQCMVEILESGDSEDRIVCTRTFPKENPDYDLIESYKDPGKQLSLTETYYRDHPYSQCSYSANSAFHELELYRLLRKQDPAMMAQKDKIGDVTFKDMNFDGEEDLLIYKGKFGALDTEYYDVFFWDEEQQTFVHPGLPDLVSAGHIVLNEMDKTITYTKQTCLASWTYYRYKLDTNNQWTLEARIDEDCSRPVTVGELYSLSIEEVQKRPFRCDYILSKNEDPYTDQNKIAFANLDNHWKDYIQGDKHPQILEDRVEDPAITYIRNHTLHFDSVQELEQWKKDHHALSHEELQRLMGL